MNNEITIEDVRTAYKKFKSYIYYDNSNLLMRKQIAEFESKDLETKLNKLQSNLFSIKYLGDFFNDLDTYFLDLINSISHWKFPKKIPTNYGNSDQLLRNYPVDTAIETSGSIYHVKAPIELHIISVLWIMREGNLLVNGLESNYGYVLDTNEQDKNVVSGLRLFKPYYNEYQKWRDRAIDSAKSILAEKQNMAIISLDLKNFYHSVRLDFNRVENVLAKLGKETTLTKLLAKIHDHYTFEVKKEDRTKLENKTILPIGFLSSGILANWYLIDFDKKINEKISPVYYGRYVDDILLTLPMGSLAQYSTSEELIAAIFEKNNILQKDIEETESECQKAKLTYKVIGYDSLEIQDEKIIIMLFDKKEPSAVLDKFKNEIRKNSSEYRFLPNEALTNESFEEASSKLIYDGSKNKLRSIKEFQDDKFGISSFLAKKIFLSLQADTPKDKVSSAQILNFFRNSRCLEYASLWEKIFTFFVLNNDNTSIKYFEKQVHNAINLIRDKDDEIITNYHNHLSAVISLAISIRLEHYKNKSEFKNHIALAELFRNARLIRKNYSKSVLSELVNKKNRKFIDLTAQNLALNLKNLTSYIYLPRYVHYHEIVLANYISKITNATIENTTLHDITKLSQTVFNNISNSSTNTLSNIPLPTKEEDIETICLQQCSCKQKLKIGVANFNIDEKIFEASYIRSPNIDPKRKKELVKILNQAISEKVDMIVLPECSIPYSWLHWIVNYAHKKQIGMVFGLEHIVSKQKAYNLIVTLLPVKLEKYNSLFIDIRVKKHYSPEEERMLIGYGYQIPKVKSNSAIYNWHNVHFTTFNCFELANIHDRARFKSKVDLVVASEYNRDTKYFSNIVESSARDLHCYFVQSNSAHYGDNRIFQPTSSDYSDILKIKGGENSALLVGTLDIQKIREFQCLSYDLQKGGYFKPTPPDYDKVRAMERIKSCENTNKEAKND